MSLSERLAKIEPRPGPQTCLTCAWLAKQSPEDQAAFEQWVADGRSPAQLRRECMVDGLAVSETAFGRHLKNHVSC